MPPKPTVGDKGRDHWRRIDGDFEKTVEEILADLQKLDNELIVKDADLATFVECVAEAKSEMECSDVGFIPMPKVEKALYSAENVCAGMRTGLLTLRKQISDLRAFAVRETTAHHDSIAGGLSTDELELIAKLNPFVPDPHSLIE